MVIAKPSWYVGCSPRDPRKLIPEIELLLEYDGQEWNKGKQREYTKKLTELDTFEGEGYEKEPDFSARDRVAKMKTYGFVYIKNEDDKGILHVTEAGKRIVKSKIKEEIFLKQMIKWQYPSFQHQGNQYPKASFVIRPFIFLTKLIHALDGLTKPEIAIFCFTNTDENNSVNIIEEIKKYREKRNRIGGKRPKREFDYEIQYEIYRHIYADMIKARGECDETKFINKKIRNSYDMADAMIRHLRFTPLFTIKNSKVVLSENMLDVVREIISLPIQINEEYGDVEKFYAYMGNPGTPLLSFDDKTLLPKKIDWIMDKIDKLYIEIKHVKGVSKITKPPLDGKDILDMKELLFELIDVKRDYEKILLAKRLQMEKSSKEIIDMYQRILDRDVIDPAIYFEWNTWKAFLYLDDEEEIKPNFTLDSDIQPISCAGGKKGDIEAYYKDFNVLIEVTLSSGERQSNTEIEPVWRHVGNFQNQNEGKKIFGLFIAPKITPDTPRHFFVYVTQNLFDGKKVTIIPLSLSQFVDILIFSDKTKISSNHLYDLFKRIEGEAVSGKYKDGISWYGRFPEIIDTWKREIVAT
jgi:hypothetical protein